jgi:MFS transporter, DHA1 family, multidrug resistance protein
MPRLPQARNKNQDCWEWGIVMNKRAFVSVCVAIFVAMLGMGIISPLLTIYAKNMGASGVILGIMYSGFSLSRAVMQPVCGWIADTKGRKMLMVIGLASYTLVSIGYALAVNIYTLTIVRLLHGVASALVIPVAQAYIGDLTPRGKEGTNMGIFSMSMQMGMAAGPLLGGLVYDYYLSMAAVFYTMAALAGAGLLLLILFVPSIKPAASHGGGASAPMSVMLKDDKIKAISIYYAARGILRQSISAFLPFFAVEVFSVSVTEGATLASIYIFTEAMSQLVIGPIADRFDRKKLMIFGGATTSILAFFLSSMTSPTALLFILIPVAILGVVGRVPAMAYNVQLGKKYGRMGSSMGITNAAQDMGHVIGPTITGWALDAYGVGTVFYVGAIAGVLVMPLMTWWLYSKERDYIPPPVAEVATIDPPK